MPILFGYLLRDFLGAFGKTMGVFIGLFLLIDGIEGIRRFAPKPSFQAMDLIWLLLSRLPNFLGMLTPAMLLLTTLLAVNRLMRHNEITVMRASGVSLTRILWPLLCGGILIALLHGLLITQIAPHTNRIAQGFKDRLLDHQVAPHARSDDLWLRDGSQIIHAKKADPDAGLLHEVTIFVFDAQHHLASRITARTARFAQDQWRLLNGIDYRFQPEPTVTPFDQRLWHVSFDPQRLAIDTPPPQLLTALELYALIRHLKQDGHDATRYQVILQRRLAAPFATLTAIVLAFPFALRLPRAGGTLLSTLIGLLLGFAMFVLGDLAGALGLGGRLPPLLAAWSPILFFCGIAGFLLFHLDSPKPTATR
ncbi:MAG: LPS export ABC transporter permease LptG [Magnetococcales bacterium]|nr:LPS export ABC transporter permease LptG [Magnetococcales bacterium]